MTVTYETYYKYMYKLYMYTGTYGICIKVKLMLFTHTIYKYIFMCPFTSKSLSIIVYIDPRSLLLRSNIYCFVLGYDFSCLFSLLCYDHTIVTLSMSALFIDTKVSILKELDHLTKVKSGQLG